MLKFCFGLFNIFNVVGLFNFYTHDRSLLINIYFISLVYIIGLIFICIKLTDTDVMYKIYFLYIIDIIYAPYMIYYIHHLEKIKSQDIKNDIVYLTYFYGVIIYSLAINLIYTKLYHRQEQYTAIN